MPLLRNIRIALEKRFLIGNLGVLIFRNKKCYYSGTPCISIEFLVFKDFLLESEFSICNEDQKLRSQRKLIFPEFPSR